MYWLDAKLVCVRMTATFVDLRGSEAHCTSEPAVCTLIISVSRFPDYSFDVDRHITITRLFVPL